MKKFLCLLLFLALLSVPVNASSGTSWQMLQTERYYELYYLNNTYILTGAAGRVEDKDYTYILKISSDFKTWTTYDTGKIGLTQIIYAKGAYWGISQNNTLYRSTDLKNWGKIKEGIGIRIFFTGQRFVAIGAKCYTSVDGYRWEQAEYKLPAKEPEIRDVVYTDKGFLIVGRDIIGDKVFTMVSRDGVKWDSYTNSILRLPSKLQWDGEQYLIITGVMNKQLAVSPDGIEWHIKYNFKDSDPVTAMKYINGQLMMMSRPQVLISRNYLDWNKKEYGTKFQLRNIVWDGKRYCGFSDDGDLYTSSDGLNWKTESVNRAEQYNRVIWSGKSYMAACDNRLLGMSADGISWEYKDLNIPVDNETGDFNIVSVASNGTKHAIIIEYQAAGKLMDDVYLSVDLVNWTKAEHPAFHYSTKKDIALSGQSYVIVGENGFLSSDGLNWVELKKQFPGTMNCVVYANGKYVAVGNKGIAVSIDGQTWQQEKPDDFDARYGLTYDGKRFIANDNSKTVYISEDGIKWAQDNTFITDADNNPLRMKEVAFNGSRYLAVIDSLSNDYLLIGTPGGSNRSVIRETYTKASFSENINPGGNPGNNPDSGADEYKIDEASSWAQAEIEKAIEYKLTTNKVLGDYKKDMTREEFCELAVKLYEALSKEKAGIPVNNKFTDTNNPEILKANALGIVNGLSDTKFSPDATITREQIAMMFFRTLKAVDPGLSAGNYVLTFSDKSQISGWALDAVGFAADKGIIGGVGDNKVAPLGNVTREQGIAMVKRTYEKFR